MNTNLKNVRLDDDKFMKMREEVLATWPTGAEVDIDEAINYHQKLIKIIQLLNLDNPPIGLFKASLRIKGVPVNTATRLPATPPPTSVINDLEKLLIDS